MFNTLHLMFETQYNELALAVDQIAERIRPIADEDLERSDEEKTSAVHFLRFEFDDSQIKALKGGARLSAGIDHDNYRVDVSPVAENVRSALISDLD